MPTLTGSSDIALHFDDTGGSGRPVVLIHGWPLSGRSWEANVPALTEAGYRVVTYDRRGFGESGKPDAGYDYDTLADDLARVLEARDLRDVTLVGFSMGGGEVARYVTRHGEDRLRSVVFAAAVPPYLLLGEDNPDGPLPESAYRELRGALESDRDAFFEEFMTGFFSVGDTLKITDQQLRDSIELCRQSHPVAALSCMDAWATTDFRDDLPGISVPALVLHGASDATVPVEGSGERTHAAIPGSEFVVVDDAPHGFNLSHREEFDRALLAFLDR